MNYNAPSRHPSSFQRRLFLLACIGAIAGSMASGADPDHVGRYLHYVLKPLATSLLLYWCVLAYVTTPGRLTKFVTLGMMFSLIGDVLLMLPVNLFIFGLLAFLAAHVAYLVAFTSDTKLFGNKVGILLYALIGGSVYALLWPALDAILKIAVAAYVIVLSSMAAQMFARWRHVGGSALGLGALGGLLFVVSDGVLAVNKFLVPVPVSALIVLGTYWGAQYLIWRSIRPL